MCSGGKDSCYNALLCQRYGHDIVALGNLYPADPDTEELDSYMYQTVGHTMIASYAECTGLPLFRKKILGSSVEQGLVYEETRMDEDEVEDLAVLLQYATSRMPEIEAVSSGAIASDYQRHRVERICSRLGLVSLAYMWHRPQSALLKEMVECGIDARLIKVAAAGLDPGKHLGKSIADMSVYLHKLRDMYGSNVCGEGGEYETLTLDCPLFVHGKIVIDESVVEIVSEDSLAPVAWMRPTVFHVEGGDGGQGGCVYEVPDGWKKGFYGSDATDYHEANKAKTVDTPDWCVSVSEHVMHSGQYTTLHGYCRQVADSIVESGKDLDIEHVIEAFDRLLETVRETLNSCGMSLSDGLFVLLFVHDMEHFGHLNKVYSKYFPHINPPSRATLELAGNSETFIAIQVICARPQPSSCQNKRVLHVQSMSDWAPCCIGPYSQATSYDGLVRFAGQIALDPTTSCIPDGMTLSDQVLRVSKTCDLVGAAMKIDYKKTLLWSTMFISDSVIDSVDGYREQILQVLDPLESDTEDDEYIEEYLTAASKPLPFVTLPVKQMIMVVQCPRLPRDAKIEIQSVNIDIDAIQFVPESDSDDDHQVSVGWVSGLEYRQLSPSKHCLVSKGRLMKLHMTTSNESFAQEMMEAITTCQEGSDLSMNDIVSVTAYVNASSKDQHRTIEATMVNACQTLHVFTVPVTGVWNAMDFEQGLENNLIGIDILWHSK